MAFNPLSIFGIGEGIFNSIMQARNYEYMKYAQEKTWQREDNAVQRRAADLEKAGLSKTLAAGSAAASASPVSLSAPESNVFGRMVQGMQLEKMRAEINYTNSLAASEGVKAGVYEAQGRKYIQDIAESEARTLLYTAQTATAGVDQRQKEQLIRESEARVAKYFSDMDYTSAQIDQMKVIADNVRSQIALNESNVLTNQARYDLVLAETSKVVSDTSKVEAETQRVLQYLDVMQAQLAGIILDNDMKEMENYYTASTGMQMGTGGSFGSMAGALGVMGDRLLGGGYGR